MIEFWPMYDEKVWWHPHPNLRIHRVYTKPLAEIMGLLVSKTNSWNKYVRSINSYQFEGQWHPQDHLTIKMKRLHLGDDDSKEFAGIEFRSERLPVSGSEQQLRVLNLSLGPSYMGSYLTVGADRLETLIDGEIIYFPNGTVWMKETTKYLLREESMVSS